MNFVEELRWRGMVHTMMPGTEELLEKEIAINNLVKQLSLNKNQQISKYILSEIENLNNEISNLKVELETVNSNIIQDHIKIDTAAIILDDFTGFNEEFYKTDNIILKRTLLKTVLSKVLWDGEQSILKVFFTMGKK